MHGGHGEQQIPTPHLLIFTLDGQRYALRLQAVQRVVRAAEITPLPEAPAIVLGILDLQGEVIPVINLRKRFRLPERGIRSEDLFVVARTQTLTLALVVDGTESVIEETERAVLQPDQLLTGIAYLEGVTRTDQGLVLIHDLETLLFAAEESLLVQALQQAKR